MPVTEEQKYIGDVLKEEAPGRRSRDSIVVLSGEVISLGQVLGKDYKAITNFSQDSGTGISESHVSLGPKAKQGDYVIYGTGSNTARIVGPDGYEVEQITSLPYSGEHIQVSDSAAIADGEQYTLTVGDSSGKYVALDPSAVNGAQEAHGIALGEYDASEGDVPGVMAARDSGAVESGLVWPDGITTEQKNKALAELRQLGIVVRQEV